MYIKTKSFELATIAKGNKTSKKIALLLPGRLDTKDYVNFTSHLDYLSKKGFYVLAFDPPGTWESKGEISTYTTTNYLRAINEFIDYFGNRPTLLLGHSRGGAAAMLVASLNRSVSGIIVVLASYSSPTPPNPETLKTGYQTASRDLPPGSVRTEAQKQFKLPLNYFKDGAKYVPGMSLKKVKVPKLLFHSTNDEFTSPADVKNVFQSILEPKMIYELSSEHDYRLDHEAIEEVNQVTGQFLDKFFD